MLKVFIVVIILISVAFGIIMSMMPDGVDKVLQRLEAEGIKVETVELEYEGYILHAKQIGEVTKPKLLLIHGSPGDWSNWENIILDEALRSQYCMIAVDRVGFGSTSLKAEASLARQTKPIWNLMDTYGADSSNIIVGHSYGGAVVEQMLLERPGYFKRAIMAAGTLSPDIQEPRWYNNFASLSLVNKILPKTLKASNIEMMGLTQSLLLNEPEIHSIKAEIVFIQGKKDVLVPYETIDYFKEYGPRQTEFIIKEKMNHFIPWSDPDLIIDAAL